jgi:hypothetical protein
MTRSEGGTSLLGCRGGNVNFGLTIMRIIHVCAKAISKKEGSQEIDRDLLATEGGIQSMFKNINGRINYALY